ncbi:MAG: hypothetical protein OXE76_04130 [Alphaproteobacteria bacterium]|nr:hypothetical protein [Alphaproteobacteria bacterium]
MSSYQCVKTLSVPAGEDLNDRRYHALTINASGQFEMADAAGEVVHGVLWEDPGTIDAGRAVTIMDVAAGGIGLVVAGAAIVAGQLLVASATDGRVAGVANVGALAADQVAFGVALEAAGAAGDIIRFKAGHIAGPHSA